MRLDQDVRLETGGRENVYLHVKLDERC